MHSLRRPGITPCAVLRALSSRSQPSDLSSQLKSITNDLSSAQIQLPMLVLNVWTLQNLYVILCPFSSFRAFVVLFSAIRARIGLAYII